MLPARRRSCECITYIVREPYYVALTPHEAGVGVSPTKTFQWHANKNEYIPGRDQERIALPVRASAHSSNARSKAHLTEQNNSGVGYMNCKESNMREGLAP
jgi:hypothetical protein